MVNHKRGKLGVIAKKVCYTFIDSVSTRSLHWSILEELLLVGEIFCAARCLFVTFYQLPSKGVELIQCPDEPLDDVFANSIPNDRDEIFQANDHQMNKNTPK